MQTESGHFAMWPGDTQPVTYITPFVAEMLLIARDGGHAVPERVLDLALSRLNEDLLSGGNTQYQYEHYEHLRLAEMAHAGYVLARVGRAPVGTLRALFDNERGKLVGGLPLMHLAAAFKAMGDAPRATQAAEEAFGKDWKRPEWLGDYGSDLRDLGVMLALAQEAGLAKPEYAARAYDLARTISGEDGLVWFSTQDQLAVLRLGKALAATAPSSFAASVSVGGNVSESTGRALVSRAFDPAQLAAGVRITPSGGAGCR
jgi:alpha-2-macroglobulin